jgi:hypothetical protein
VNVAASVSFVLANQAIVVTDVTKVNPGRRLANPSGMLGYCSDLQVNTIITEVSTSAVLANTIATQVETPETESHKKQTVF